MKIRTALPTDFFQVRHLIELSEQARLTHLSDIFGQSSAHEFSTEVYRQLLSDKNASVLLAENQEDIVGLAIVRKAFYPSSEIFRSTEYAFLEVFHVSPEAENSSEIKQKLITEVKNWADYLGFYHLEAQLYAPDANFDFFQQMNFEPFYHRFKMTIREKPKMDFIFHITNLEAWEAAELAGFYEHASLQTEGFIHCCTDAQIEGVMSRYFQGQTNLLLLEINPELLEAELKFEIATDYQAFPHLYGRLNLDAVMSVYDLEIEE